MRIFCRRAVKKTTTKKGSTCWDPALRWRNLVLNSESQFRKQNVDLFTLEQTKGQSEARIQLIYVSQKILELGYATELYHIGCAKYEKKPSKKDGSYQAASKKRSARSLLHALQALGQKPKHEVQGLQLSLTSTTICVVDMEGAQKKNIKF